MTETRAEATPTVAIITAVDRLWHGIRGRHPDVPQVVIAIAAATWRGKGSKLGHFQAGCWQRDDARLHEFFLSGEALNRGSAEVLNTALHEAAHGVAHARGILDYSRQGRYHNTRFRAIAAELGLDVAEDATGGWHVTSIPEATAAAYRRETRRLDQALTVWRHRQPARMTGRASSNNGAAARCGCSRRIRASLAVLAEEEIWCGYCNTQFTVPEPATSVP